MNKPWKVALVFTAVFVAGGVAGGLVAVRMTPTFVQRRVFTEQFVTATMRVLSENLKLSPQQVEKIRPIVAQTGDDLVRLRQETSATFDRMNAGLMRELNPEQRELHKAFLARLREREERDRERARKREAERAAASAAEGAKPADSKDKVKPADAPAPAERKP